MASSFGTPLFAQSALLWFFSLIFFSCNLSSEIHVLQFFVPKSKEMWIVHIDILCNITTNTKRINKIHKKTKFWQIIFTSLFWKPFLNFHPFLLLYNSLKLVPSYQTLSFLRFKEISERNHHACCCCTTLITIIFSSGESISNVACYPQNWNQWDQKHYNKSWN